MNDNGENQGSEGQSWKSKLRRRKWLYFGAVLAAAILLAIAYWWFFKRGYVSTDDAYVHADIPTIGSRIKGTAVKVLVENDQPVKKGDVLVELDATDYLIAVHQAEAALSRIQADIRGAEVNLALTDSQTKADLQAAQAAFQQAEDRKTSESHQLAELQKKRPASEAELAYAKTEYRDYEELFKKKLVSQKERDQRRTDLAKAQADLNALDAQIKATQADVKAAQQAVDQAKAKLAAAQSAREKVKIQKHHLESLRAQAKEAEAEREQAVVNLSYTTIRTPIDGHVAKKSVQIGDQVAVGQPLMSVVPLHAVYVEANFKETQLAPVRIGHPAVITADIYPGHTYHGHVVGISAGTGAAFQLLPPENATGNWIKVVRRLPVRIALNHPPPKEYPLRVGLSLKVTIDVRGEPAR